MHLSDSQKLPGRSAADAGCSHSCQQTALRAGPGQQTSSCGVSNGSGSSAGTAQNQCQTSSGGSCQQKTGAALGIPRFTLIAWQSGRGEVTLHRVLNTRIHDTAVCEEITRDSALQSAPAGCSKQAQVAQTGLTRRLRLTRSTLRCRYRIHNIPCRSLFRGFRWAFGLLRL